MKTIKCKECETEFERTGRNQKFCSRRCYNKKDYRLNRKGSERERERCREKAKRLQHSITNRFLVYKRNATLAGLEFMLTKEILAEFTNKPCFYCGVKTPVNGVDRVDSSKGYVEGNMVSCCKYCNRAKSDLSQAEFFALCARVYQLHTVPITFE